MFSKFYFSKMIIRRKCMIFSMSQIKCFTDIDECLNSPCDVNAMCTDNDGSFDCTCNIGFTGDGLTCMGKYYPVLSLLHFGQQSPA